MADQKPALKLNWDTKVIKNKHHLLFFRRNFCKEMWSKRLREHPYLEVMIPADTLHRQIHEAMTNGVPCPSEFACETVWHDLEDLRLMGLTDERTDGIERRLNNLIELFSYCGENADDTIKALITQKYIVRKFYGASH